MARNDGIDRTVARNQDLETPADVAKVQEHNEREKDSYSNQDIVPERTSLNVHFKAPTDDYVKMFEQMEQDGVISTRGLKPDAVKYGELVFDVNSAYFYNHGGYEFAKQFYADAYKAAAEIVGGEQYILSAVMHADERNRAMSEALGEDVYHYHLHVVYIPVVEKQILWSKRCKDEALRGTVKEVITQVSRSKKWESKPVLGEDGNPMLNAKGKKILKSSYSISERSRVASHIRHELSHRQLALLKFGSFLHALNESVWEIGGLYCFPSNLLLIAQSLSHSFEQLTLRGGYLLCRVIRFVFRK